MADNKLPLQTTGVPAAVAPLLQPQQPVQPAPLAFSPQPAQPPANNLMSILTALGGLGLNVTGIATGAGAAGDGALRASAQLQAQSADNQRETQRAGEAEKEAVAIYKQAKDSGISGSDLDVVRTLGENRQIPQMRSEVDRVLSVMRQRREVVGREREYNVSSATQGLQNLNSTLKTHPGAVESFLADFSDNVKEDDKPGNIQTRLQTEARKAGISMNSESAKQYAKTVLAAREEAKATKKTGGILGFFQEDAPPEQHKSTRQMLEGKLNLESVNEYKTLTQQREQVKQAVALLRSKPNSPNYQKGLEMWSKIQAGEIVAEAPAESKKNVETAVANAAAPSNAPKVGEVKNGYKFKGGNPADPKSWSKI
jgi:hypothetical protein